MRVLIDLQSAQTENRFRDIGQYSLSLAQAMAQNSGGHEIWVALNGALPGEINNIYSALDGLIPEERIQRFNMPRKIGWMDAANAWRRNAAERMWEAFLDSVQPDFIYTSSLFEGAQDDAIASIGKFTDVHAATAATVHDIDLFLQSKKHVKAEWESAWRMDKIESLRRSNILFSISEHVRQEILRTLDVNPDRVINISSAISPCVHPVMIGDADREMLRARFDIKNRYVMCGENNGSHRDVENVLKAFAQLGDVIAHDTQLVVIAKIECRTIIANLADQLGIADRVVHISNVSSHALMRLYSAAATYVSASSCKGFCFPALEAITCGVPTIGANTASISEVIGKQDALFDSEDSIARDCPEFRVQGRLNNQVRV